MANNKHRQIRGTGGLIKKANGTYEGRYRVYRKNGTYIEKSFTRLTTTEINDIKAKLHLLGIIDDDVIGIKIDKRSNEIILEKTKPILQKQAKKIDENILVNDYIDYWLWNHRRRGIRGKLIKTDTFEDYVEKSKYLKRKIAYIQKEDGTIINLKMTDLTFEFLEEKMLEISKEVVHSTAIQIRNHLYSLMKYAKSDKVLKINPIADEKINLPVGEIKNEIKVICEEDIEKVIEKCLKYWYIDVLTQIMTGTRASEIRGMKWCDVNEETCEIKIVNNYITATEFIIDKDGHIISNGSISNYTTLKSTSSNRIIKVDSKFMKILMIHKNLQRQFAERSKVPFSETDPVFTGRWYRQLGKNTTNDRTKKIVKELEIKDWEGITSHCLRKSFCYAGILNNVPINYMSKLMGHSSVQVTERYYLKYNQEKINEYATQTNTGRIMALSNINSKYGMF